MWIQTYSGGKVDLLDPRPDQFNVTDVAHALSNLCRYTGHVPRFYSVAQHSVLVSRQVPPEDAFAGLMHDAAEAYVGDCSSPLKRAMRKIGLQAGPTSPYDEIERRIAAALAERFGLPPKLPESVKVADLRMLMTEKAMLGKEAQSWDLNVEPYPDLVIDPLPPEPAWALFVDRFVELGGER
jgi:hypothetical protein